MSLRATACDTVSRSVGGASEDDVEKNGDEDKEDMGVDEPDDRDDRDDMAVDEDEAVDGDRESRVAREEDVDEEERVDVVAGEAAAAAVDEDEDVYKGGSSLSPTKQGLVKPWL